MKAIASTLTVLLCAGAFAACGSSEAETGAVRTYAVPSGQERNDAFEIRVRPVGGDSWRTLSAYRADVDLRDHAITSMASFDTSGPVEVAVTKRSGTMRSARVRPASRGITPRVSEDGRTATFTLQRPTDISFEPDGDTHANLQLFVNAIDRTAPTRRSRGVWYYGPGVHRVPNRVLVVPDDTTVEIAGGAVLRGVIEVRGKNVVIQGHGVINPGPEFELRENPSTILIEDTENVAVRDVTMLDSAGGGILVSKSKDVAISRVRMISSRIWTDGIDISPASNVTVEDSFIRTSDDSVAIYASTPWGVLGDTDNVVVRNTTLWPDVAHPVNVGTHGSPRRRDRIERVLFSDIDVLGHNEPNPNYQGVLTVNAGDAVRVDDVKFDDVRVEQITAGQLFNVRVFLNGDYNDDPGRGVSDVLFRDVVYAGDADKPSQIHGYDEQRAVRGITFENVRRAGATVLDPFRGNLDVGDDASGLAFRASSGATTWDDSAPAIRYSGRWDRLRSGGAHRGGTRATASPSGRASFSFAGRRLRVYGALSPAGGLASVSIDGGRPVRVDTYAGVLRNDELWFESGQLRPGRHTVTIRALGQHNPLASAQRVVFDRVEIDP